MIMKNSTLKTVIVASIALGTVGLATAENRAPTKGFIPDEAFEGGRINIDKVPDYMVVYARDGQVAGYIRKTDYFVDDKPRAKRIKVVDESLSRAVGHMVMNRGFVPLGAPDEATPEFDGELLTPEEVQAQAEDLPADFSAKP